MGMKCDFTQGNMIVGKIFGTGMEEVTRGAL